MRTALRAVLRRLRTGNHGVTSSVRRPRQVADPRRRAPAGQLRPFLKLAPTKVCDCVSAEESIMTRPPTGGRYRWLPHGDVIRRRRATVPARRKGAILRRPFEGAEPAVGEPERRRCFGVMVGLACAMACASLCYAAADRE